MLLFHNRFLLFFFFFFLIIIIIIIIAQHIWSSSGQVEAFSIKLTFIHKKKERKKMAM